MLPSLPHVLTQTPLSPCLCIDSFYSFVSSSNTCPSHSVAPSYISLSACHHFPMLLCSRGADPLGDEAVEHLTRVRRGEGASLLGSMTTSSTPPPPSPALSGVSSHVTWQLFLIAVKLLPLPAVVSWIFLQGHGVGWGRTISPIRSSLICWCCLALALQQHSRLSVNLVCPGVPTLIFEARPRINK